MQLDHLVEKIDTAGGAQARLLEPREIQRRCIDAAVRLVAASRNKDLGLELVKATKRLTAPENAIDLTGGVVELALAACNELAVYEVFTKALSYPKDNTF